MQLLVNWDKAMPIDLQKAINSRLGLRLVSFLGQALLPSLGYPLANRVAALLAGRRSSNLIRAVRLNQWVARGAQVDGQELDRAVVSALRHSARSLFELYHYLPAIEAVGRLAELDPVATQLVSRPEFGERGLVVAGLHLSNFDLILQWMCASGMKAMILTLPDPQGARRMEYERRRKIGMNLVPASVTGLREAVRHLRRGGLVVTGIDRPIPDPPARPCFFGRPAALPIHYTFLAMKASVPIRVIAPIRRPDGSYHVSSSNLIEMDASVNREAGALHNAERVLSIAEQVIRPVPEQWAVPLPVWPDLLPAVPA